MATPEVQLLPTFSFYQKKKEEEICHLSVLPKKKKENLLDEFDYVIILDTHIFTFIKGIDEF